MKKIIYLLVVTALVFTGCDPMSDIDKQDNVIVGETTFTLSDDDYAAIDPLSDEDNYEVDKSFKTFEDAKNKISTYLSEKFPVWGKGSLAIVTFNLDDIEILDPYEVTAADYEEAGFDYPNFGSPSDMANFLLSKYPDAVHGNIIELTYRYYVGGGVTEDRVDKFMFLEEWIKPMQLSSADYNAMGQSYPNFSDVDTAIYRMAIYFKSVYPYAEQGDNLTILYKNYVGSGVTKDRLATFTFDGTNWISTRTMETVKFGHNGNVWEPDNTIRYTLVSSDYSLAATALESVEGYEAAAENLGSYGNFNRTGDPEGDEPTGESKWNNFMMAKALGIVLDNLDPSAEIGQKYLVTFNMYNGASGTEFLSLIKTDEGWILNQ